MSEFLIRNETCEYWVSETTPEEFDNVVQIREGNSSLGYTIKNIK